MKHAVIIESLPNNGNGVTHAGTQSYTVGLSRVKGYTLADRHREGDHISHPVIFGNKESGLMKQLFIFRLSEQND
jgi:hypothetical protein